MPLVRMLDVGDASVDLADLGGAVERNADVGVHLTARVDLAHPVVAIRVDAKAGERIDEDLRVVAGVGRMAVVALVGNVCERAAHLALDSVGAQQRLGVHGIHVVNAVQVGRLDAIGPKRTGNDVEDDGAAEATDVDRAGRCFRVVDDLRTADGGRQLVGPVHRRRGPRRS